MVHLDAPVQVALLDDHPLFRQGLRYILQKLPYVDSIVEASEYAELLALCQQRVPDLLLLDLQLPNLDGSEVTQRLLARYPQLKIIVLSMFSADKFIQQLLKLGARSYLPKDADHLQLINAVEEVLTSGYHITPRIARALDHSGPTRPAAPGSATATLAVRFTRRELDVLRLLCEGCSTAVIAEQLFLSPRTVEGHRQRLLDKTNAPNAAGLVLYAMRHGLLSN